ncbi:MAG: mechanosensitive ion channel family protein [Caldilineaceae bacterium SB0670_bin_27]|uniref:Mechanosensitive ion channel family protein n=1 Tax=Caldilineaceae bacterium SB0664_bin_27 TaxID=2605260 RepID=A0A6B0YZK9_9CHLR|nr:mechanosensitive ion channel family protein [Caldilineaceae bacterium SB0664_bin_27]MYJ78828.1 mechanosensitive ion channel family protein [Caldilineaceae bacterium SB0670_bin_27]
MSDSTSQPTALTSTTGPLFTTVLAIIGLLAVLSFTSKLETYEFFNFLLPYESAISVVVVAILGHIGVQSGTKWVYAVAQRRTSEDVARTLRVIARLLGYGLIFSFLVSVVTDNAVAELTMGSFAGLVAGFASQTVMGHTVAGVFLAIFRPVRLGENVTIGRETGEVADITLMHIVLDSDEKRVLIPSSTVVGSILIKNKPKE